MGKDNVEIAVVAYGPGINMFRKDRAQVLDRLESLKKFAGKSVAYTVCSNTMEAMKVERPAIIEADGRSGGEAARGVSAGR